MATRTNTPPERADRRPRAAHLGPERRRPLVLDAALSLFVERGYRGTSMEAIAESAGVTKPVVYECYPSKEELFKALLEREEQRLLEAIAAALPSEPAYENVEGVLREGFTAVFSAAAATPDSWRVLFVSEHGAEPAVARRVQRGRQAVVARLVTLVEPFLVATGVQDSERLAPLLAEVLASIGEAGVRILLASKDDWTPEELGKLLGRLVGGGTAVGLG